MYCNFFNKDNKILQKEWKGGSDRSLTETQRLSLGQLRNENHESGKGSEGKFSASEGRN